MIVNLKWEALSERMNDFLNRVAQILEEAKVVSSEEQLQAYRNSIKEWDKECLNFLKESFVGDPLGFIKDFNYAGSNRFDLGLKQSFEQEKKKSVEILRQKQGELYTQLRILAQCDLIISPESVQIESRASYTMQDTINLLLIRLYRLYDNMSYPILPVLTGNGIRLNRQYEEHEIVRILMEQGLVESQLSLGLPANAQLTLQGKLHVESMLLARNPNYRHIPDSASELSNAIDDIIERLKVLGDGQEILFEELQELKGLHGVLNKKNFGQQVKGKLVDLALSKVISMDTVNYIFKKLTETQFELPSAI